ncbi:hypothetical protein EX30DRAFT_45699 [Ascodesmis nigricans]|uniref:Uncharacterized protein n=1 Tax=Ascodesmis nigricans TaxID=341454 RepID=A0A4V3SIQ1_9PEZI|nr:hypothetical protein EX30DRAFT_45699 [Ascodesmis nigricans]
MAGATDKDWIQANQPQIHGSSTANMYSSYRRRYGEVDRELEEAEVVKGANRLVRTYGKGLRGSKLERVRDADDAGVEEIARVDPKRARGPGTDSDSAGYPKELRAHHKVLTVRREREQEALELERG